MKREADQPIAQLEEEVKGEQPKPLIGGSSNVNISK
jgi:hypothetical protein